MIDFHCHLLPNIDDGAANAKESLEILEMLSFQGIDCVTATPHFLPDEMDVHSFIDSRESSFNLIKDYIPDRMKINFGAEVLVSPKLLEFENYDLLCVNNSKCILLEMPFFPWQQWMFDAVLRVRQMGYIPVIAHAERYAERMSLFKYNRFFEDDCVYMQFNAHSFLSRFKRNIISELIKKGASPVFGSDAHNLGVRKPCVDKAAKIIKSKFGGNLINRMDYNAEYLLSIK